MATTFYSIHDVYLMHHGIKGQKWGVRRYQNPDGTLTAEGQKRYATLRNNYMDKNVKSENYGNFSTKKSAKRSFGLQYVASAGAAAGMMATGIGLIPAAIAAAGVAAIVGAAGAIRRERARKFALETGFVSAEDIKKDRMANGVRANGMIAALPIVIMNKRTKDIYTEKERETLAAKNKKATVVMTELYSPSMRSSKALQTREGNLHSRITDTDFDAWKAKNDKLLKNNKKQ